MSLQAPQVIERDELLQRRREGGAWLREMREKANLSQRELATAVGADYYSFVSQLEAGKGRVPITQVELWAKALGVPRSVFAKGVLRYYDPITYDMLFEDGAASSQDALILTHASEPASSRDMGLAGLASEPSVFPKQVKQPGPVESGHDTHEDLRARITRIEAILMLRGARP